MHAVVTGCAGFIGSHVAESLLRDGHRVTGVDCLNDNYPRERKLENLALLSSWSQFRFVSLDLAAEPPAEAVADAEVVFHVAAEPGVRSSWDGRFERYVRNNMVATRNLLEAVRTSGATRVVYASSSSVYGVAQELPTSERAPLAPVSPYGVTKLAAEQLCDAYHCSHGVPTVILRYFTVYGPRQRPDMAFAVFCRAAIDGGEVPVHDGGAHTRDFTFVGDVVAATRRAAEAPAAVGRTYNVGSGSPVTVREALATLSAIAERPLEPRRRPREPGEVPRTYADIRRAGAELGFAPRVGLEDGLRAQLEWTLEHARGA